SVAQHFAAHCRHRPHHQLCCCGHGSCPAWYETFAVGEERDLRDFVHEVRRCYPFFPAIPGRVRAPFTWHGHEFELMTESVRQLTRHLTWQVPTQDMSVQLNRFPAMSREGMLLSNLRPTE